MPITELYKKMSTKIRKVHKCLKMIGVGWVILCHRWTRHSCRSVLLWLKTNRNTSIVGIAWISSWTIGLGDSKEKSRRQHALPGLWLPMKSSVYGFQKVTGFCLSNSLLIQAIEQNKNFSKFGKERMRNLKRSHLRNIGNQAKILSHKKYLQTLLK